VFLGEVGARRGIAYDSRKMDPEGESFIFKVEASGVYALKFYRQDFAHDLILNDHVQIIAGAAPETTGLGWFNPSTDRSRVIAGPRWPNFLNQPQIIDGQPQQQISLEEKEIAPVSQGEVPTTEIKQTDAEAGQLPATPPTTAQPPAVRQPAEAALPPKAAQPPVVPPARQPSNARTETVRPQGLSGGDAVAQSSPAQTPSPPPPPAAEPKSPDTILKEARDEFNAGRIAAAITLLDQFCKSYPSGSDEAWWLYGQCYEANSPNRNILSALDYYRRLVREYPQSSRLSDARRRISYLERYYINIQ
jgi:TolA-binding protein